MTKSLKYIILFLGLVRSGWGYTPVSSMATTTLLPVYLLFPKLWAPTVFRAISIKEDILLSSQIYSTSLILAMGIKQLHRSSTAYPFIMGNLYFSLPLCSFMNCSMLLPLRLLDSMITGTLSSDMVEILSFKAVSIFQ